MRSHSDLERLEAAGQPLLAEADSLVNAAEEDRILERILSCGRESAPPRRPRAWLVLAAAAVVVAIAVVLGLVAIDRGKSPGTTRQGGNAVALSGAKLQLAGFHFRTPAGFKDSSSTCVAAQSSSGPVTATNGFAAAASADGGCIEAFFMIADSGAKTPADEGATPVAVGSHNGYYVPPNGSGESTLYIQLPTLNGTRQYLMLAAENLTEGQLVAIAASGFPG